MRVLLAAGSLLLATGCSSAPVTASAPNTAPAATPTTAPTTGPEVRHALPSCVETYSPQALRHRGFAFDGTVAAIGSNVSDRAGRAPLGLAGVTFAVHHWYVGGPADRVSVDLPLPSGLRGTEEAAPSTYGVGTRLLVSGESRWGEPGLSDAIAWGCGFTREHDERTAAAWASAVQSPDGS